MGKPHPAPGQYRPRRPTESPFYKLVAGHFDEFERVYPERYQSEFGFWRPVIRDVVDEFLKCGDLHHGFARVRCVDCGHDFILAFFPYNRKCANMDALYERMKRLSVNLERW